MRRARTPFVNDALSAKGLTRKISLAVPNLGALFRALRTAELIAFVPWQMARQHQGWLKLIETDLDLPSPPIVANWHPRMATDARHIWLRDLLSVAADAQLT